MKTERDPRQVLEYLLVVVELLRHYNSKSEMKEGNKKDLVKRLLSSMSE